MGDSYIVLREKLVTALLRIIRIKGVYKMLSKITPAYSFTDYFKGFESNEVVRRLFGTKTSTVLQNLKVEFTGLGGYMGINASNGHLMVNAHYLKRGRRIDIYLDLIHELVHIRQFMEGKELFDTNYSYVDRPTEIEAYQITVNEARRLQLSEQSICEYLKTEWMSEQDWKRLAHSLNIQC